MMHGARALSRARTHAVLERIALHQTRLQTPGLTLDAKGVALGAKGLLLLPSIDRLVGLLSIYSRDRSLEDIVSSLSIHTVRSKLGAREITFEFAAESSDRMDRLGEACRLVGGLAFTGTARHFVKYRDAMAPFGYDATELLSTDAAFALYSDRFTQTYEVERPLALRSLLVRLMLRPDASTRLAPGPRVLVAEPGLGPALVAYLLRSGVAGEACVAEWPPASAFDDAPIRRWVVRVAEFPSRMGPLLHQTPGIHTFIPWGAGVAVEAGFRHPVELRSCPLFDPAGLVLLRGRDDEPWLIDRLPIFAELTSFAHAELRKAEPLAASSANPPPTIRVPLGLVASSKPWQNVTATFIAPDRVPLLRRMAYALPRASIAQTEVALTARGAFLRSSGGVEAIPLGTYFVEIHPLLYVTAGHEISPSVAPDVLARALDASPSSVVFIGAEGHAVAIERSAFVPLESALLEAPAWEPLVGEAIAQALADEPIDLRVTSIGMLPLQGVEPPPARP